MERGGGCGEIGEFVCGAPNNHDDVVTRAEDWMEMAKRFAREPLDAIALDGFADTLPGNGGVAIVRRLGVIRANTRHQRSVRVRFPLRACRPNLCFFAQPQSTFHRGSHQPSAVSRQPWAILSS
jgi:hypothetical protein